MHKLQVKRGNKSSTHYFSHVTEDDGKKKHVYLGDNMKDSKDRLTELKVARIQSDNSLIRELEDAQKKLDKLGFYNKSYDEVVDDVIKSHHREKHIARLMDQGTRKAFPWLSFIIFFIAIITFGTASYFFVQNPEVTGSAVRGIANIAANRIVSTSFGMFVVIVILGVILHKVDYRHRHKYDEYKPPMPPV